MLNSDGQAKPTESREMQKVVIAGDESDLVVDAGLRDQAIGQSCSMPPSDELRAELAGSLPVTCMWLEQRKLGEHSGH